MLTGLENPHLGEKPLKKKSAFLPLYLQGLSITLGPALASFLARFCCNTLKLQAAITAIRAGLPPSAGPAHQASSLPWLSLLCRAPPFWHSSRAFSAPCWCHCLSGMLCADACWCKALRFLCAVGPPFLVGGPTGLDKRWISGAEAGPPGSSWDAYLMLISARVRFHSPIFATLCADNGYDA